MARKLYVDVDEARLVSGLNSSLPPMLDNLFEADVADYELYFLTSSQGPSVYEPLDWSGKSVKFAIGAPPPSAETAYVAQNSWSNLPSTVSASVTKTLTGGIGANDTQTVQFTPEAFDGTFSLTFPSQLLTFTSLSAGLFTTSGSHGLSGLQPFVVTGFGTPTGFANGSVLYVSQIVSANQFYANTTPTSTAITAYAATTAGSAYTITASTSLLLARATSAEVTEALESLPSIGEGNVQVLASPGSRYRVSFTGSKAQAAMPLLNATHSLTPFYGKTATVNLATSQLANAISASASIEAALEIEVTEGGKSETVTQALVTLRNDLITTTGGLPTVSSPASFFYLLSPNNTTFSVSVDDNGILTTEQI